LSPRVALAMAASLNLVGALVSTRVAGTVGKGIIAAPKGNHGLVLVFAALVGAIAWNLTTWYFGLPSSSSQALIGGLIGAALVTSRHFSAVQWHGVGQKVVIPIGLSLTIGLASAFIVMLTLSCTF